MCSKMIEAYSQWSTGTFSILKTLVQWQDYESIDYFLLNNCVYSQDLKFEC